MKLALNGTNNFSPGDWVFVFTQSIKPLSNPCLVISKDCGSAWLEGKTLITVKLEDIIAVFDSYEEGVRLSELAWNAWQKWQRAVEAMEVTRDVEVIYALEGVVWTDADDEKLEQTIKDIKSRIRKEC